MYGLFIISIFIYIKDVNWETKSNKWQMRDIRENVYNLAIKIIRSMNMSWWTECYTTSCCFLMICLYIWRQPLYPWINALRPQTNIYIYKIITIQKIITSTYKKTSKNKIKFLTLVFIFFSAALRWQSESFCCFCFCSRFLSLRQPKRNN